MFFLRARSFLLAFVALVRPVVGQAVFAHFMNQNSYSYSQSDWENDIKSAQAVGIDGFALNTAGLDYEPGKISLAFAAAEELSFNLFLSFDMSYTWTVDDIVSNITAYASSSSMYTWNDSVLVSTYTPSSEGATGVLYPNDFYEEVKSNLEANGTPVVFAPALTYYRDPSIASTLLTNFPSVDGFLNWWSWPDDVDANLTTATDMAYQAVIDEQGKGPYIMGVSPWQFKDISGDGSWVELSDTLWHYRWEQVVNDVQPDMVEILTWNDYGESTYISEINTNVDLGTDAPNYVDGYNHSAWREVAEYYIEYFKNGSAPEIDTDKVVFWYRTYPKNITCSGGQTVQNSDFPVDAVFAMALLTEDAEVTVALGTGNSATTTATAGISMHTVAFPDEDEQIPYVAITRNGETVADGYGSLDFRITDCTYYNFNPFVAIVSA
ncbi:glycoside hydrolase family 71 protein [Fistulina hepatica ATCC 64428]|nr:glycoside hydrolase family 71 protein [Fistulina hepatica ATCC 64428]